MQRSRERYAKERSINAKEEEHLYMQRSREPICKGAGSPMQKEGSHLPPPRADNYGSQERVGVGGGGGAVLLAAWRHCQSVSEGPRVQSCSHERGEFKGLN